MAFMDCGALMQRATAARELTDAEVAAYRAPFPDEAHMAGAREFPALVPITPEHGGVAENNAAWEILERWDKPFLTLACPGDPVLGQMHHEFIERVPGASGQPHQEFAPGGHFIQDDCGEEIAACPRLVAGVTMSSFGLRRGVRRGTPRTGTQSRPVGEWWALLAEAGWSFPAWPEGRGGRGLSPRAAKQAEQARLDAGAYGPPKGLSTFLVAPTLLTYATSEQLDRFMPGIVRGTDTWCQLFSEPGAGSDLAGLSTRAVRDGDEWTITGQKVWNSGAQNAAFGILMATDRSGVDPSTKASPSS